MVSNGSTAIKLLVVLIESLIIPSTGLGCVSFNCFASFLNFKRESGYRKAAFWLGKCSLNLSPTVSNVDGTFRESICAFATEKINQKNNINVVLFKIGKNRKVITRQIVNY